MKLLYGTSNLAKLAHMCKMLEGLEIEIIGLKEDRIDMDVAETGDRPLENAKIKALAYYHVSGIPTFSCDSGLFIEGLAQGEQPGVHVRRVDGRYLDDEAFIEYYAGLARALGGRARAKFANAICFVLDENHIFTYEGDDIADHFILTETPCSGRKKGFPMDSVSLDIETGTYLLYSDRSGNEKAITRGFREFFLRTIGRLDGAEDEIDGKADCTADQH